MHISLVDALEMTSIIEGVEAASLMRSNQLELMGKSAPGMRKGSEVSQIMVGDPSSHDSDTEQGPTQLAVEGKAAKFWQDFAVPASTCVSLQDPLMRGCRTATSGRRRSPLRVWHFDRLIIVGALGPPINEARYQIMLALHVTLQGAPMPSCAWLAWHCLVRQVYQPA